MTLLVLPRPPLPGLKVGLAGSISPFFMPFILCPDFSRDITKAGGSRHFIVIIISNNLQKGEEIIWNIDCLEMRFRKNGRITKQQNSTLFFSPAEIPSDTRLLVVYQTLTDKNGSLSVSVLEAG